MTKTLRNALQSLWDLLLTAGPVALIAIAILAAAYWWLDPTPPRSVRLATGPAQSAYAEFGNRYATALPVSYPTLDVYKRQGQTGARPGQCTVRCCSKVFGGHRPWH